MQWIKHMTDMVDDPKIRRLIRRHGALGYAVYNLTLERIGKRLCTESPLPDLEETSEDVADLLNTDTLKVEEVMKTAVELGLFENDQLTGRILCGKIYKFIQQSETRSKHIRGMISHYKASRLPALPSQTSNDMSETSHDMSETSVIEQNRTRTEEKKRETRAIARHPTLDVPMSQSRYDGLVSRYGVATVDDYMERVRDWASAKSKRLSDFASAAANWIKNDVQAGKLRVPVVNHDVVKDYSHLAGET